MTGGKKHNNDAARRRQVCRSVPARPSQGVRLFGGELRSWGNIDLVRRFSACICVRKNPRLQQRQQRQAALLPPVP